VIEEGAARRAEHSASKHTIRQREPVLFSASSWQTLVSVAVPNAANGNSPRRKADGDIDQSESKQQKFIHNVLFAGVSKASTRTFFIAATVPKKPPPPAVPNNSLILKQLASDERDLSPRCDGQAYKKYSEGGQRATTLVQCLTTEGDGEIGRAQRSSSTGKNVRSCQRR